MTTSNRHTTSSPSAAPSSPAPPGLRLRLVHEPGRAALDGAWWPHSRDLPVEVRDLVDHFPPSCGRITRVLFSPPDWDSAPHRVEVSGRFVKVGCFPRDDTHLVLLTTSDRTVLRIVVIPPDFTPGQAEEALLAGSTPHNAHSAADLLAEVSDNPEGVVADYWDDDGGAWWGTDTIAPSYRRGV